MPTISTVLTENAIRRIIHPIMMKPIEDRNLAKALAGRQRRILGQSSDAEVPRELFNRLADLACSPHGRKTELRENIR